MPVFLPQSENVREDQSFSLCQLLLSAGMSYNIIYMKVRQVLLLIDFILLGIAHKVKFVPQVLIFDCDLEILNVKSLIVLLKLEHILP
jgi:hypothetical protein